MFPLFLLPQYISIFFKTRHVQLVTGAYVTPVRATYQPVKRIIGAGRYPA